MLLRYKDYRLLENTFTLSLLFRRYNMLYTQTSQYPSHFSKYLENSVPPLSDTNTDTRGKCCYLVSVLVQIQVINIAIIFGISVIYCCHTRLHLGFSANLRIWQAPACKMGPQSGVILWLGPPPHRLHNQQLIGCATDNS